MMINVENQIKRETSAKNAGRTDTYDFENCVRKEEI